MRIGPTSLALALAIPLALSGGCSRSSTSHVLVLSINEVMARNESFTEIEPNGLALDWVEIYNPNPLAVRLEGYSLSDDPARPNRYRFPAGHELAPGGFFVVFLVGDEELARIQAERAEAGLPAAVLTPLHADFGLSAAGGEVLYLFAGGRRIDRLGVPATPADASFGRFPDGGREVGRNFAPTPGEPNHALSSIAPDFAVGGEPQAALCADAVEEVELTFTVLTDAAVALPQLRLRLIERPPPGCSLADQERAACEALFAAAGAAVREIEVVQLSEAVCQTVFDEQGVPVPPPEGEVRCPRETTDGSFGTRQVRVLQYQAFLPPGATFGETADFKPSVLYRLEVEDELGRLEHCRCYVYGSGCFTLVVSEYQPVNRDTVQFIREDDPTHPIAAPDWVEIFNYGEEAIDLTEFGLVGRDAIDDNPRAWLFGRDTHFDSHYTTIGPGERRLVLAVGDGGEVRRVYRRLAKDAQGNLVPDMSCRYYSTRFALNPRREGEPDEFALTAPAGSTQVVIDRVVLDFSAFFREHPPTDPKDENAPIRDLAAIRLPVPEGETPRDRFPPNLLRPGEITACPTPAGCPGGSATGENRIECARGPAFVRELVIVPLDLPAGARAQRCPELDGGVLVTAYLAVDLATAAAFEAGEPLSFRVELEFENARGERMVLTLGSGITATRDPARQAQARPGTVLMRLEAVIPPQPEGLVRILRLEAWDDLLAGELEESELTDFLNEERVAASDPEGHSRVSFSYLSGPPPLELRGLLSEVVPENRDIVLPGFEGFVGGQSPPYVELHLPADAPVERVDLSGFFLTVEPSLDAPIREARRVALPEDLVPIERGGFLLLVDGPIPPRALPVPTVDASGLGLAALSCRGAVHLIGPDELGNCVADSLAWQVTPPCESVPPGPRVNVAYGPACEDPQRSVRVTASPGAPNTLPPIFVAARHASIEPTDERPNPCDAGLVVRLAAVVFLDDRLVARRGGPGGAVSLARFAVSRGTLIGAVTSVTWNDVAAPPGYVTAEFRQTVILPAGGGIVEYRVEIADLCGRVPEDCGAPFCFTLRGDGGEAPELFVNEVNRSFPVPGGGGSGRPWIELYNPSPEDVDLGGMSLSADARFPRQLVFADGTVVPPQGALVVLTDGGKPLSGPDAPAHVVVDFEWVPRRDIFSGDGEFVRRNCGFDPVEPAHSAPPVELYLIDRTDRGSCLVDDFVARFPDRDCNSPVGLGRLPDGGPIAAIDDPTPGRVAGEPEPSFLRGDADGDGEVTLTDAVGVLEFLFHGAVAPPCLDVFDADDNGRLNVSDAVYLLGFLFRGGPPPPPPFPAPGSDPTEDELSCAAS
jgi:hypothetical protein